MGNTAKGMARALAANDAYDFLRRSGDLTVTGPTNTNVCDLYFAIAW